MSHLVVAAIDFGTTYSGWAFSFRHEYERDPTKVQAKNWSGGQLVSQKGPTCVLINPDGCTLEKFGYEAESMYGELALEEDHERWYYFKRFKMMLFGQKGLNRNVKLEDATGKKLAAITVFSLAIKYLKDDLIKTSEKRIGEGGLTKEDIHWVLTVPAIWDDAARGFMREAARDAGIDEDKLTICLEPEAASIFCRHLPVEKSKAREKHSLATFKPGTKYMILDAGGGTVDITVHEIKPSGDLRELHKASGGAWGGTKVDAAFEKFLSDLFGEANVRQFQQKHMDDYIELFRDFEIKKREISAKQSSKMNLRIPRSFFDLVEENADCSVKVLIQRTRYQNTVSVVGDKLRTDPSIARSFFDNAVHSIVDHVRKLLKEPTVAGCSAIVMVGGFSESPMLQENVQDSFNRLQIIIPEEAGLAVLRGAVIYGHNPKTIAERICRFTYGHSVSHKYLTSCSHPKGRIERDDNGDMRCYDIFSIHAKIGEAVKLGEECKEITCTPVTDDQTSVSLGIYASSTEHPYFVTEPGCSKIGSLTVPIPDTSLGKKREFGVTFKFGGTEIEVKVADKAAGTSTIKHVDFLGSISVGKGLLSSIILLECQLRILGTSAG